MGRRWAGVMVNEEIPEPRPPRGGWIDDEECHTCGAKYRAHRASGLVDYGWHDAVEAVRSANGGYRSGGGYRSRGAVLWAKRALKLADWYMFHEAMGCGDRRARARDDDEEIPF